MSTDRAAGGEVRDAGHGEPSPQDLPFGSEFYRKLFENLYDGVYFVDRERRILFWNKGAEQLSGYPRQEVLGSYCHEHILDHVDAAGNHLCTLGCPLARTIADCQPRSDRVYLRHKDGRRIAIDVHIMPLVDESGATVGGIEVFRDASSAVALEGAYEQLRVLAERDSLTATANRRHLEVVLGRQIDLLNRTGIPFSVILADIDRFKLVNDTFGHKAGDETLVAFAAMLLRTSRPCDVVARYGGEEFLVVLQGQRIEVAATVAERFRALTGEATPAAMAPARLTASFGVSAAVLGDTVADLVQRADEALYQAKHNGRDRVERRDPPVPPPPPGPPGNLDSSAGG